MADQAAFEVPRRVTRLVALGSKVRETVSELKAEGDSRWSVPLELLADRLEGGGLATPRRSEDDPGRADPEHASETTADDGGVIALKPGRERQRAMTIAYTALWQLRELDPEAEDDDLRYARLELRKQFDAMDEAEDPTAELSRKERNLLGWLAAERLYWLGDELMFPRLAVKKARRPAHRIAYLTALLDEIGWRVKVKKKAKGQRWSVPVAVLAPALAALIEEARTEETAVSRTIDLDRKEGNGEAEAESRRSLARWERVLVELLDLQSRVAPEGGPS